MTPTPSAWTRLRAAADPWTRRTLGLYSAYEISREEYVGTVEWPLPVARRHLRNLGYRPQRLSAAKRHHETGDLHVLSMRRVPDEHPTVIEDYLRDPDEHKPAIFTDYPPSDCQHHVHAFPTAWRSGLDVFSHYELRPLRHPWAHYRPTYGETYLRGIADPALDLGNA